MNQPPYFYGPGAPGPYTPPPPSPLVAEGRSLWRFFFTVTAVLAATSIFMPIVAMVIQSFLLTTGTINLYDLENGFSGMTALAFYLFFIVLYGFGLFLPFFIASFTPLFKKHGHIALPFGASKVSVVPFLLLGLGVCAAANYANALFLDVLISFGYEMKDLSMGTPADTPGRLAAVLAVGAAPALVEEYIFRGLILQGLRRYGTAFAIVTSAAVFALFHLTAEQLVFAFIGGLFFGYLTVKTDSLWPAIVLHFLNNAFSVAMDFITGALFKNASDTQQAAVTMAYLALLAIIGLTGLLLIFGLKKCQGLLLPPQPKPMLFSLGARFSRVLLNPGTVLLVVIWLFFVFEVMEKLLASLMG